MFVFSDFQISFSGLENKIPYNEKINLFLKQKKTVACRIFIYESRQVFFKYRRYTEVCSVHKIKNQFHVLAYCQGEITLSDHQKIFILQINVVTTQRIFLIQSIVLKKKISQMKESIKNIYESDFHFFLFQNLDFFHKFFSFLEIIFVICLLSPIF